MSSRVTPLKPIRENSLEASNSVPAMKATTVADSCPPSPIRIRKIGKQVSAFTHLKTHHTTSARGFRTLVAPAFELDQHKLTASLRFSKPEMEVEFLEVFLSLNSRAMVVGVFFFLTLFLLLGFFDILLVDVNVVPLLVWRFSVISLFMAVFWVLKRLGLLTGPRLPVLVQVLCVGFSLMLSVHVVLTSPKLYSDIILSVLCYCCLFRLRFFQALRLVVFSILSYDVLALCMCFTTDAFAATCPDVFSLIFQNLTIFFIACQSLSLTFMWEFSLRRNFLVHLQQGKDNTALRSQYNDLKKQDTTRPNLDTPVEVILSQLGRLQSSVDDKDAQVIQNVLQHLKSGGNLLQPTSLDGMTADVSQWVSTTLLEDRQTTAAAQGYVVTSHGAQSSTLYLNPSAKGLDRIQVGWDFDIFEAASLLGGRPLRVISASLFEQFNLSQNCNLPVEQVQNFIDKMEEGYYSNPYHNSLHAADMSMTTAFFLKDGRLQEHMSDIEILATLVAAIVHDLGHPGVTNNFLAMSGADLAIWYNDKSILENFHVAQAFRVMKDPKCDIFANFSTAQRKELRKLIIDLVLATDLTQHFEVLTKFKTRILEDNAMSRFSRNAGQQLSYDDRLLVLKVIIKCGDVSHSCKNEKLHREWSYRVTEEFLSQGDRERSLSLPVSAFMDRREFQMPASQIGFINFIVLPLYEAFHSFMASYSQNMDVCLENLRSNRALWEKYEAEKSADAKFVDAGFLEWSQLFRSRNTPVDLAATNVAPSTSSRAIVHRRSLGTNPGGHLLPSQISYLPPAAPSFTHRSPAATPRRGDSSPGPNMDGFSTLSPVTLQPARTRSDGGPSGSTQHRSRASSGTQLSDAATASVGTSPAAALSPTEDGGGSAGERGESSPRDKAGYKAASPLPVLGSASLTSPTSDTQRGGRLPPLTLDGKHVHDDVSSSGPSGGDS